MSENIATVVGTINVIAKGKAAEVAVTTVPATDEYPMRVRITRDRNVGTDAEGRFVETVGYVDKTEAAKLASLLMSAIETMPDNAKAKHPDSVNGPVVTKKRGRPAKVVEGKATTQEPMSIDYSALAKAILAANPDMLKK